MFIHNVMIASFYARPGKDPQQVAIYLKVRINGDPVVLGAIPSLYTKLTGTRLPKSVMIDVKYWDADEERVRTSCPHAKLLNRAIDTCRSRLDKLFAQHEGFEMEMDAQVVKELFVTDTSVKPMLTDLLAYFLKHKADIRANPSTINTYDYKFRPLRAFLDDTRRTKLLAESFDAAMLDQYRTYLIARRNNKSRAADKACQVVKTVFIWANDARLIATNPLANKRIRVDKTPNIVYLTQAEVDIVRTGKLPDSLRAVADCFVFSCYTGMAYQDMKNLTPRHIQLVRGMRCLVGKRQKTDTDYCIPISTHVQTLLDKYGTDLPLPGNDYYNRLLKRVMDKLGIDKEVSSHVGRKTFIDWYVNELGLTVESAVVAMGQKNPSELRPYLRLREQLVVGQFPRELLGRPEPKPVTERASTP